MPRLPVLVVEDERSIRDGICDVLAYRHYEPTGVETGEAGLEAARSRRYALVVLDVMLPMMNGFDVCTHIRRELPELPVVMLTAKGSEDDILRGFECGADDYVTKPFSVRELLARIEALLKRAGKLANGTFSFGPWQIDAARLTASDGQAQVELTPRELEIVRLLKKESGRIVSRRVLLRQVWGFQNADQLQTRTVDVQVGKLRKKLRSAGALIETVRGAGYRIRE
jgi:two-component system response regulator RegX3